MKLHRLRAWSGYLGFLLFVLLLFFFTDAYVFFLLGVLFFCLPLFSLLLFRLQTRHLQIELQAGNDTCQIRLHAPSPLGSPLIHLQLDTYNRFTQERAAHTLSLTEDTDHHFSEIAMGVIDIQGVRALAKDALGLFCWRRPIKANIQLLHVPAPMAAVSGEPLLQGGQKQAGSWQDTHEVREYQPGDSLRWIHHKLSYKSGRLMVRAFENDTHPHVILFLDLSTSLTQNETTIALYQGACAALLKDGVRCTVRWYSEERSCSCSVSDPYQLHASLHQILAAPCAHSAHIPPQARSLGEGLYLLEPSGGDGHDTAVA